MNIVNIADLKNQKTGKIFREENNALKHKIALKTLVETENGLRLFVVSHDRDCDGTPLYSLSFDINWREEMYGEYTILANSRKCKGYSEECLKIIK